MDCSHKEINVREHIRRLLPLFHPTSCCGKATKPSHSPPSLFFSLTVALSLPRPPPLADIGDLPASASPPAAPARSSPLPRPDRRRGGTDLSSFRRFVKISGGSPRGHPHPAFQLFRALVFQLPVELCLRTSEHFLISWFSWFLVFVVCDEKQRFRLSRDLLLLRLLEKVRNKKLLFPQLY